VGLMKAQLRAAFVNSPVRTAMAAIVSRHHN